MPCGRAVKVACARPVASVTAVVANCPFEKKPHASLEKTTLSPTDGCPSASKNRTAKTCDSPPAMLERCGDTVTALAAAHAVDAIEQRRNRRARAIVTPSEKRD